MDTKKLRQKILDLAIRGKLVPQDPNDEPASVLLERIRAEKEQLIKEGKIKRSKKSASTDKSHYENVPFEIPESWCWVEMSDIFLLNPKNEIGDDVDSGFIPMANANDGFSGKHTFIVKKWGNIKKGFSHFRDGDIGVAKISPCFENLKSVIFSNLPNQVGAGTTELVVLRGILVNSAFYLYLVKSGWYISEGTKYFKGVVGQQRVHRDIFTSLQVPMPPLNEQQLIVDTIRTCFKVIDRIEDDKIELESHIKQVKSKILDLAISGKLVPQDPSDEPAIELLKRINPNFVPCDNSHYENLPFEIPESWCWCNGEQIFLPMISCKPTDEFFKYIDIESIDNKNHKLLEPKVLKSINAPSRASRYTKKGDVLFSMVRPYLKNIALVDEDNFIASTGFYICSPSKLLISNYCYYMMLSNYVVNGLNQFMKGDNSPSINNSHITSWLYPIPPLEEQRRIVDRIESLYKYLNTITAEL